MFVVFSMPASLKKAIGAETHAARYQSSLHRQVPLLDSQSCGFPGREQTGLWSHSCDDFRLTSLYLLLF